MRLINADALIDTLYDHEFASYIDKGEVSTVINDEPTVDAVPVQWLYELAEQKENEKDIKLSAMIKGVVALWHMEKRKKNDTAD